MLDREIAEFGRRMGMTGFTLSAAGVAALDVDKTGRLFLERGTNGDEVLVYLVVPVPAHDVRAARRVLEICSFRHAYPMPLSGGVHANQVVLLTRMSERDATAAALENSVHFLAHIMEQVV